MSHRCVRDAVGFVSGIGSVVKVLSRQPLNPSLLIPLSGGVVLHSDTYTHPDKSVLHTLDDVENLSHTLIDTKLHLRKEHSTQNKEQPRVDGRIPPEVKADVVSNVPVYDSAHKNTSEAYFNRLTEANVAHVQAQAHIADDDEWFSGGKASTDTSDVPPPLAGESIPAPSYTHIDTREQTDSHPQPRRSIADEVEDVVAASANVGLDKGIVLEAAQEKECRKKALGSTVAGNSSTGEELSEMEGLNHSKPTALPNIDLKDNVASSGANTPLDEATKPTGEDILSSVGKDGKAKDATASLEQLLNTHEGLGSSAQARRVPVSAASRLFGYAGLFTRIGTNMLTDRVKESVGMGSATPVEGRRRSRVMTERNADAMVNTLCRMRGAALKLGQVLSIQDNTMVAPEIQTIFNRVRLSADFMPADQMMNVLSSEMGENWRERYSDFAEKPMAAASIGQVHRAQSLDGRKLAVKIQYPGIADSIDSDFGLLLRLLKMTNALPEGAFLEKSITCSRDELVEECQYLKEAEHMENFRALLKDDEFYHIPLVDHELTTNRVLTMEYVDGVPLEQAKDFSQDVRNRISYNVMRLCLKELFEWRYMQTDPNWANFLYDSHKDQLNLLDFGAARRYEPKFIDEYLRVIKAAADNNKQGIADASHKLGYLTGFEADLMVDAHCSAVLILGEPFAAKGKFDFHGQDVTRRINELIPIMLKHRLTPPPQETYSLHRKLSGAFLICARLRASIDVSTLFEDIYNQYEFSTT
ncbi:atypical/ABC1/ABC1-A protein kinase [Sphaeroforma arctica JP610]|uniref:Atypical/ABC1/ABC1-A protein kinase n=1 Tax=Sphaeroforma arctica JP610 TaxID=667725 RepID=A0A0L0FWP3_9EUKA|nr:atypical/ABC1/ABC1-A protein kinase [Sphaeroforma arctica JP610]KNC80981.1 atypical/ABC1/ABC1-A protein kinase [Sphaeroforma arctica JP610]|eukprot:XP_014154883.1 atypical/ABC1/ABC1-A protein kinase [Sphaeroforma arctica JP610]